MQTRPVEVPNTAVIYLQESDLKQAYWLIQRTATLTPKGLFQLFFFTLLATVGISIKFLQGDEVGWTQTILLAGLFPFVMVGLAAYQNGRAAKRAFAQQKSLHAPYTLTWNAQEFSLRSDHVSASLPWGDLTRVVHNGKVILLCESDQRFHTLPRHCLTPAQQADLLRAARIGAARTPTS